MPRHHTDLAVVSIYYVGGWECGYHILIYIIRLSTTLMDNYYLAMDHVWVGVYTIRWVYVIACMLYKTVAAVSLV